MWNHFLAENQRNYRETGKKFSQKELSKQLTNLKKNPEFSYLNDVSSVPLQQALINLDRAYSAFFKSLKGERKGEKIGLPRFKKRQSRQSAAFMSNAFKVRFAGKWGFVYLPKIGEIKFRLSREKFEASSVTLIKEADGTYHVSFVVDVEEPAVLPAKSWAGVDVGLTDIATVVQSDGRRYKTGNPRHFAKSERKLAREQRSLSRKKPGSNRREKQRLRVAKTHSKVARQRADFAHKLSQKLVNENQVLIFETLNIKNMAKSSLAKSIYGAAWSKIVELTKYKAAENHRDFIQIGQFEPTTRVCSNCRLNSGVKSLSVRAWVCDGCGVFLDRDFNAAVNVLLAGGLSESLNGRGEVVSLAFAS